MKKTTKISIGLLNQQLADAIDLGLQVKQAHWNVKGPNFAALHEFFDDLAKELSGFTDELAERAVALGGIAQGTTQVISRETRLAAYPPGAQAATAHLTVLSSAFVLYGKLTRAAIAVAEEAGDDGTVDLLTSLSRQVDKFCWKICAHAGP